MPNRNQNQSKHTPYVFATGSRFAHHEHFHKFANLGMFVWDEAATAQLNFPSGTISERMFRWRT